MAKMVNKNNSPLKLPEHKSFRKAASKVCCTKYLGYVISYQEGYLKRTISSRCSFSGLLRYRCPRLFKKPQEAKKRLFGDALTGSLTHE